MSIEITFIILLAIVAILYSSVGHGGASGYLALMAIFAFSPEIMKSSALTLNIFVSLTAFYSFYRNGYFNWRIFIPLVIASIPAAFIGSGIIVNPKVYKVLLGFCLLIAIGRLVIIRTAKFEMIREPSWWLLMIIGGCIGLFSGMIGIGGGIILSPVLLLLKWANIKETAGISALFIFVNSLSGVIGLKISNMYLTTNISTWVIAVILGGLIGSFLGSYKFNANIVRYLLASVLLLASFKLFLY